jgi:hypothetical protein
MLPLFLVYYFEYLINQSMFFPAGLAVSAPGKAHISTACHTYSTLQFLYQVWHACVTHPLRPCHGTSLF